MQIRNKPPTYNSQTVLIRCLGFLLGLLLSAHSAAEILLTPYDATYTAKISGFNAKLNRSLSLTENQQWLLSNKVSIFFAAITEQSQFVLHNDCIETISYQYINTLSSKHNSQLSFDWQTPAVTYGKNQTTTLSTDQHYYDQLSFQAQLRLDLLNQPTNFLHKDYAIIDDGKIKTYQVDKLGEELLETPAGEFNAIKFKQQRLGSNKHIIIWMAKDWQYLILKLERFKNGKSDYSLQLKQATLNGEAIKGL